MTGEAKIIEELGEVMINSECIFRAEPLEFADVLDKVPERQ